MNFNLLKACTITKISKTFNSTTLSEIGLLHALAAPLFQQFKIFGTISLDYLLKYLMSVQKRKVLLYWFANA